VNIIKKAVLTLAALAALVLMASPANAQYLGDTTTACNTTLSSGFSNARGFGPNGELVVRVYLATTYQPKDPSSIQTVIPSKIVDMMNYYAQQRGYSVRFVFTPADNTVESTYNFTANINLTDNGNASNYQAFVQVGGWGQGHLFRFHSDIYTSSSFDALADIAAGLASRFNNGWTCGTQAAATTK
jgi:hypothetical protein